MRNNLNRLEVQHKIFLWNEIIAVYNLDSLKVEHKDACRNPLISLRWTEYE